MSTVPEVAQAQLKTADEDHPMLDQLLAHLIALGGRTSCWVCASRDWAAAGSDRSFGIVATGLRRALRGGSDQEFPMAAMQCRVCSTVWLLAVNPILAQLQTNADEPSGS